MKITLNENTSIEDILEALNTFEAKNGSAVLMGNIATMSKIKPDEVPEENFSVGLVAMYSGYKCIATSSIDSSEFLIVSEEELLKMEY